MGSARGVSSLRSAIAALLLGGLPAPVAWGEMLPFHLHGGVATTWEADNKLGTVNNHPNDPARGTGDPEAGNARHQHYNTVDLSDDPSHDPFAVAGVWVNRTNYNLVREPVPGQVFPVARYPIVPHGFIDESDPEKIPRYRFVGDNWTDNNPQVKTEAEQAQELIVQAFEAWSALEAGVSPVSKLPLKTGLAFRMVAPNQPAEMDIRWGGLPANVNGVNLRTFDQNGVTTSYTLRFNDSANFWFFGKPEDTPANRYFFYTTALHEVGHVVGLFEQDGAAAIGDIMMRAQRQGPAGAMDRIDPGSMQGAFALYSIPVPQPSALVLAALGALGLLGSGWRRRRRSDRCPPE
jgi:hypothetical protein